MSMSAHVSGIYSSTHFHLCNLARIRSWGQRIEHLVHAFIASKLDMGNALAPISGLPDWFPDKEAAEAPESCCPLCHWNQWKRGIVHLSWKLSTGFRLGSALVTNFSCRSTEHFTIRDLATLLTYSGYTLPSHPFVLHWTFNRWSLGAHSSFGERAFSKGLTHPVEQPHECVMLRSTLSSRNASRLISFTVCLLDKMSRWAGDISLAVKKT